MRKFAALRPYLDEGVPLPAAARAAGVPTRTAQRWLSRYRAKGLDGLKRKERSDQNTRRLPDDLIALIEGLALRKPRRSCAAIHRRVAHAAESRDWPVPSYGTVHSIMRALDPAMVTLAQDGPAAYRDRFELIYRHRASAPNVKRSVPEVSSVPTRPRAMPSITMVMPIIMAMLSKYKCK